MIKNLKGLFAAAMFVITAGSAHAQCAMQNTAFQPGEFLAYNLY